MTIIISVFVPERSRAGTNPLFQFLYQEVTALALLSTVHNKKLLDRVDPCGVRTENWGRSFFSQKSFFCLSCHNVRGFYACGKWILL